MENVKNIWGPPNVFWIKNARKSSMVARHFLELKKKSQPTATRHFKNHKWWLLGVFRIKNH
jgi:hypothetical protein